MIQEPGNQGAMDVTPSRKADWPGEDSGLNQSSGGWPRQNTGAGQPAARNTTAGQQAAWDGEQSSGGWPLEAAGGGQTAGGRQNGNTGEGRPLKAWQQDTWYGPYPHHENPFDEPEDAPELRELRSDELNNRSGEFWESGTSGYHFGETGTVPAQPQPPAPTPEEKAGQRRRRIWTLCLGALVIVAAVLVLYFGVFTVRNIAVQGYHEVPAAEVIRLSGLRLGMPMLSLNEEEIGRGIEQNVYLKFRYLDKEWPDSVTLRVQEREACCWMTWNGILYVMDKEHFVLYETEDLTLVPANLVRVDGLNIRAGALAGQELVMDEESQQEVFSNLFLELRVLSCTELIEIADLSNLNSLLLTTRDGFTVSLGGSQNIHAKLRSMLLTREELLNRGYRGGIINVTLPENPIFTPSET